MVGVLVALLAMADGYTQTLRQTGGEDTVIIMRGGSASEVSSVLSQEEIVQIQQAKDIARDAKGEPLLTAEGVFAVTLPVAGGKDAEETGSVQIRGISAKTFEVRTQAKIIEGPHAHAGSARAGGRQRARRVSLRAWCRGRRSSSAPRPGRWSASSARATRWTEIWGDAATLADAYRRGSSRNSITARPHQRLGPVQSQERAAANPQLKIDVMTTVEFSPSSPRAWPSVITVVGLTIGTIMAIGATFGALNTMFAAVAARATERSPRCAPSASRARPWWWP